MPARSRPILRSIRTIRLALALGLLAAAGRPALAAPGDEHWSNAFASPGASDVVYATANLGDTLVVAGAFEFADGLPMARIARWYGGAYHPMGAGFDASVRSLAVVGGTLYAAGDFDSSGATPLPHVARWNGAGWEPVGNGPPDVTVDLALAADGTDLLLLGSFTTVDSPPVAAAHLARWNGAWHALGDPPAPVARVARVGAHLYAGGPSDGGPALFDWDGTAWSVVPAYDDTLGQFASFTSLASFGGALVVCGDFASLGGTPLNGIARYDGTSWSSLGGVAPDGAVELLGVDGGVLRAVGQFTTTPGPHVATWNGSAWTAAPAGLLAYGGQVHAFSRVGADLVYGGAMFEFLDAGAQLAYCGGVVRFAGGTYRAVGEGHALRDAQRVDALLPFGGRLLAAGVFVGSTDRPGGLSCIAAWDGVRWAPVSSYGLFGSFDPECHGLAAWNGQVVAVGSFTQADAVLVRNVARWDGAAWHDVGGGFTPYAVTDVAALGAQLIVAGARGLGTSVATGAPMGDVARWDGTQWIPMGARSGHPSGAVACALTVWNGRAVYGSTFTALGGVPAANIAAWDGSAWSALGAGLDGPVTALGVHDGALFAAGDFTASDTTALPGHVARWDGTAWAPLASGFDAAPTALASVDGRLCAAGPFLTAGGQPANGIATWDGAAWDALGSGLTPGAASHALAAYDSALFVGGAFTMAGAKPASAIASWTGGWTAALPPAPRPAGRGLALAPPWPNPARGVTRVAFRLPVAGAARVDVLDLEGRRVRTLVDARLDAGEHRAEWDTRDARGAKVRAGVYWVRVRAGADEASARVVIAR